MRLGNEGGLWFMSVWSAISTALCNSSTFEYWIGYMVIWDTWICRNPDTLDGVFRRPLAGLVYGRKTCHRRMSIEDSIVCAGEHSPPVGQLVP
ncbi:unnamed protein product [Prunus armeniaca]